jgi:hypothetical protein
MVLNGKFEILPTVKIRPSWGMANSAHCQNSPIIGEWCWMANSKFCPLSKFAHHGEWQILPTVKIRPSWECWIGDLDLYRNIRLTKRQFYWTTGFTNWWMLQTTGFTAGWVLTKRNRKRLKYCIPCASCRPAHKAHFRCRQKKRVAKVITAKKQNYYANIALGDL